jgi:hypothetical protein
MKNQLKVSNFGVAFRKMSWPKKLETEEDISQLINAYQAKSIFKDLRNGNMDNLFKFF